MLQPLYTQVACEFADLHDRPQRMRALKAIAESLRWPLAREFFYWRLRRRLVEEGLVRDLVAADGRSRSEAREAVRGWGAADDKEAAVSWRSSQRVGFQWISMALKAFQRVFDGFRLLLALSWPVLDHLLVTAIHF